MKSVEAPAREILVISSRPGSPIACDMTGAADTPQERIAEYGRLFSHALIARDRGSDSLEFRFSPKAGVAEWVADLARREAACCPFFSYRVVEEGGSIVWRTSSDAGAEAQAMLDEFHDLPEHCSDGLDGYLERLAQRGVAITSPAPRKFAIQRSDTPGAHRLLTVKKSSCGC